MYLYLKRTKRNIDAKAKYETKSETFIVLKDSVVSESVSQAEKFKSARKVEKLRIKYVENNVVKEDVVFKSSSTAANFVTGSSTNGMIVWKDENGIIWREMVLIMTVKEIRLQTLHFWIMQQI